MACLDLDFNLNLPDRISKLEAIFDIYGNDYQKTNGQKWADHEVQVTYKKRIVCTKAELIDELKSAYAEINSLVKGRHDAFKRKDVVIPTQKVQWEKFLSFHGISHQNLCQAIRIKLSIAPNSGWVGRAYSILEMICSKWRNKF